MKVKSLTMFNVLKAGKIRKKNEIFEATTKRAEELNSSPHGVLIEVVEIKKGKGKRHEEL